MNQIDALLLVFLVPFALRGYVRGFCRESVGLAGLVGGALAAAAGGSALSAGLLARHLAPPLVAPLLAYAAIFVAVNLVAHLVGRVADHVARALLLGGVNRLAGVAFGVAKGAAFLGFLLLVAQQVAPVPSLTRTIADSRLGRPLTSLAMNILAAGRSLGGAPRPNEQPA